MPLFRVRGEICTPRSLLLLANTAEEAEETARQTSTWTLDPAYTRNLPTERLDEEMVHVVHRDPDPGFSGSGKKFFFAMIGAVLFGAAWYLYFRPSAASIELEPGGDVSLMVGSNMPAPVARALDAQGNVMPHIMVRCTSDTPAVRIRDGKIFAVEEAQATIVCGVWGAEAHFTVNAI
jgi:hypothetical protein